MHTEAIDHFSDIAAEWDSNATRVGIAQTVAHHIDALLGERGADRLLDFGCGTGLVSLFLYDLIKAHIVAADTSPAMLAELEKKIAAQQLERIEPRQLQTERDVGTWQDRFDLVASSMTFHHIKDTRGLVQGLYHVLQPGGHIAIADLDQEDGNFHPAGEGVAHYGFARDALAEIFSEAGFKNVQFTTVYEVEREADPERDLSARHYPVFLLVAEK